MARSDLFIGIVSTLKDNLQFLAQQGQEHSTVLNIINKKNAPYQQRTEFERNMEEKGINSSDCDTATMPILYPSSCSSSAVTHEQNDGERQTKNVAINELLKNGPDIEENASLELKVPEALLRNARDFEGLRREMDRQENSLELEGPASLFRELEPEIHHQSKNSNFQEFSFLNEIKTPRKRLRLNSVETELLMESFEKCDTVSAIEALTLQNLTKLPVTRIKAWFTNRRRYLRKKREQEIFKQTEDELARLIESPDAHPETANNVFEEMMEMLNSPPMFNSSLLDPDMPVLHPEVYSSSSGFHVPQNLYAKEGNPSSSRLNVPPTENPAQETDSRSVRTEKRMDLVSNFSNERIIEELNSSVSEVKVLVDFYLKDNMGMRQMLLNDTLRMKQLLMKFPLFTMEQDWEMRKWRNAYFDQLMELEERKEEINKTKYHYCKNEIVAIWHPVIIYAKLSEGSLRVAASDIVHKAYNWNVPKGAVEKFKVLPFLKHLSKPKYNV